MQRWPAPRVLPPVLLASERGKDALRAAARRGSVVRVARGAYVARPAGDAWERETALAMGRIAAAGHRLGDPVFSHITAAMLHGCWSVPGDGLVHIVSSTRPHNGTPGLLRHRADPGDDVVRLPSGVWVTSLPRTLLDCAALLAPRWGLVVADSAMRALARPDRFARSASQRRLDAVAGEIRERVRELGGHRFVVRQRAVVDAMNGWSESPGESSLRWVALAGGAPPPECQYEVEVGDRLNFVDLAWERAARGGGGRRPVIGEEYDGREKYAAPGSADPLDPLIEEKRREDDLRRLGIELRRRDARDLRRPARLFADLRSRFEPEVAARFRPVPGLMPLDQAPTGGLSSGEVGGWR